MMRTFGQIGYLLARIGRRRQTDFVMTASLHGIKLPMPDEAISAERSELDDKSEALHNDHLRRVQERKLREKRRDGE